MPVVQYLERSRLFGGLGRDHLRTILPFCTQKTVESQEVV